MEKTCSFVVCREPCCSHRGGLKHLQLYTGNKCSPQQEKRCWQGRVLEAEGPVPGSGLRGLAEVGSSTWPKYKPLDGRRENGTFALLNSNSEAFSPLAHGVSKSNTIKKKKKKRSLGETPGKGTEGVCGVASPPEEITFFSIPSIAPAWLPQGHCSPRGCWPHVSWLQMGKEIIECFGLEGPLKILNFQPFCHGQVHLSRDQILGANSAYPQS